jgi:hypothetical protein
VESFGSCRSGSVRSSRLRGGIAGVGSDERRRRLHVRSQHSSGSTMVHAASPSGGPVRAVREPHPWLDDGPRGVSLGRPCEGGLRAAPVAGRCVHAAFPSGGVVRASLRAAPRDRAGHLPRELLGADEQTRCDCLSRQRGAAREDGLVFIHSTRASGV